MVLYSVDHRGAVRARQVLELELLQPHMAQKPVKLGARVLRVRSVSREEVWSEVIRSHPCTT